MIETRPAQPTPGPKGRSHGFTFQEMTPAEADDWRA